jgi:small subunit ribosomal protein S17
MAKEKTTQVEKQVPSCSDIDCPTHGNLSVRGRSFKGTVISKHIKRVCIEFERTVFIRKYERFAKKKTRIHARLPPCLNDSINIGDYIEVRQCRQLSKIISFVVTKKIRDKETKETKSGEIAK